MTGGRKRVKSNDRTKLRRTLELLDELRSSKEYSEEQRDELDMIYRRAALVYEELMISEGRWRR